MSESQQQPTVTFTLAASDAQLVMSILQQALAPYQRLALVMQDMQRQGQAMPRAEEPALRSVPRP